tara:strand:- start:471 stop:602 length:132 start_codon:yes stop_codon:yes gene_type:complete
MASPSMDTAMALEAHDGTSIICLENYYKSQVSDKDKFISINNA